MADSNNTHYLINVGSSKNPNVYAKISPQDAELALRYKWSLTRGVDRNGPYYVRAIDRSVKPVKQVKLHRLITNAPPGMDVDHINGDPLDNRRENLRIVTHQQNGWNWRKRAKKSSMYKGVCWHAGCKKWRVTININGKQVHLGMFSDEMDGARAYDKKAKEEWGEYAHLNLA